ncbi:MAG: hypothetical protein CVV21_11405 [Candidatus Goldiibacteriota bacterium HGW-Goldbacteria-1]|jgi:hypothetical protein|nr:MAG: hypothetical protein CVV21_11405 [Candidatus Goldiibacteriota bacterium HGW-Goldbacteria-1]
MKKNNMLIVTMISLSILFITSFFSACSKDVSSGPDPVYTATPVPTAVNSRLCSVTAYTPAGVLLGSEVYYYNLSQQLVSHDVKYANGTSANTYEYLYDVNGRIYKINYFSGGNLTKIAEFTYNTAGKLIHTDQYKYDGAVSSLFYEMDFTYNSEGKIATRRVADDGDRMIFNTVFVGNTHGQYTRQDFYDSSNVFFMRIEQDFDHNNVMRVRRQYNSVLTVQNSVTITASDEAKKTDIYVLNGLNTLQQHGVYLYEDGVPNIDENAADMYEQVYCYFIVL